MELENQHSEPVKDAGGKDDDEEMRTLRKKWGNLSPEEFTRLVKN
ncbi:MAG: hypothetical protein NTX98_00595 [Candidatus Doudnabacteria bacterium]|nr:hypothetical protein [Candidatus Doudnabacteria bacterium]